MKIVLTGAGGTGFYLAELLLKEGHDLVVVEKDPLRAQNAEEHLDAQVVTGNGANALTLEPLLDENTDLFISLTNHDEINIIGALIARRYGVKRAIVRVSDPTNLIHPLLTEDPNVSMLNAEMVVTRDLTQLVGNPTADEVELFASGKAEMARLDLADEAQVVYKKLEEVSVPKSWLIVGVVRDGKLMIAKGSTEFLPGDQVLAIGDPSKYKEIEQFLGLRSEKVKRVIMVGMNAITKQLAKTLRRRGIEVRLIEEDREKANEAAAQLNHVLTFQGDGTSDEVLEQAGVEQADYLLALTSDDENNVLISLLAKEKGVKKVVALTEKRQYQRIAERVGVDIMISARSSLVDELVRIIHRGSLVGVSILESGQGRMMEFTITAKSKLIGEPLSSLKLPDKSLVGAIVRESEVIIPRGNIT